MSSKKKRSAQAAKKSTARTDKQLRADRKKLRELGLISKKVNLRKKPNTYQKRLIERYRDLLSGKAKLVELKDKNEAKQYKDTFQVVDNKIIVPKRKGERITYNKKTGELKTKRKVAGRTITKTISKGELGELKFGEYYVIQFGGGQRFRTNSLKVLQDFMQGYETKPRNPFKNWRAYVEIEHVEDSTGAEIPISRYRPQYKKRTKRKGRVRR